MSISSKIKLIERNRIEDSRGWFLKAITGKEENLPQHTGEVYITCAIPKESKGGHYHNQANEWFTLITGQCEIKLIDMITGERLNMNISEHAPKTIYIPSKIAHIFVNNGENDFILIAYTDQLYDPADTISFTEF